MGCDGAKIVIERGNNAGSAKIPSSYWRQAANPYAWLSGFARIRCARRIIGGKRREILQKLLPYSSQIGIDTKDFRGANGDGENAVHGAKLFICVLCGEHRLVIVDVMDVIFSVPVFFHVGKVAVHLGDAFEDGISTVTQPGLIL